MPIQPLYLGHTAAWVDYSHGIRLVQQKMIVNRTPRTVGEVLADIHQPNAELETSQALDGRIQFLLKGNPERQILHTVKVERNDFIHAMLTGTPIEGRSYE